MQNSLIQLLLDEVNALGNEAAAKKYGVSTGTLTNWKKNGAVKQLECVQMLLEERGLLAGKPEESPTETFNDENVVFIQLSHKSSYVRAKGFFNWIKTKGPAMGIAPKNMGFFERITNLAIREHKLTDFGLYFRKRKGGE